jgi:primosomal protein N'
VRAAVIAVAKAGRLVGSRREARGHVVLQTRRGEDGVVQSLVSADFDVLIQDDVATAKLLALRPYGAGAEVSGDGAEEFVAGLREESVSVRPSPSGYEVRAPDVATLTSALQRVERPTTKFRVAVD